jgi:D-sedoheptulose 7-phosphate isomerase
MTRLIQNSSETSRVLQEFAQIASDNLLRASESIIKCFQAGGKLMICGNGGSAADSQHLAAEFVGSFNKNLDRPGLPAIALTTDSSIITAFANDFTFDKIFARQLEALGSTGDLLIVFSTSGNSINCVRAVEQSKKMEIGSIAFLGSGGLLSDLSDTTIQVPSTNTQIIQQCHIVAYHSLIQMVEESLF